MRKIGVILLFAFGGALASAPSQFDDRTVSVSYADLNIHSEAGAKVLYTRLKQASKNACSMDSYREQGSLARMAAAKECYNAAHDKAVSKIDSEALKKIHTS